jgi:hypothetical protein
MRRNGTSVHYTKIQLPYGYEMRYLTLLDTKCLEQSADENAGLMPNDESTVESPLSDLNGTEGQSDNRKCQIIRKTNEKDDGKYQLNLYFTRFTILLNYEENTTQHQIKKSHKNIIQHYVNL